YSRFWTKFMRDMGLVKHDEPVERMFTQGMVIKDGAKMSKSLGNIVTPDQMVSRFGADAARLYSLFAAPPDRALDWQDTGIDGIIELMQCFPRSLRCRFRNSGCTASRRAAEVRAPACPLCSLPCTRSVGNHRREGKSAPRPLAEIRAGAGKGRGD